MSAAPAEGRHPMTGNALDGDAAGGMERHEYDVVVVGAGGAGLRAAIAAHEAGARTAVVCKSLLGKAHTVMAEGGIAAAMGNRWPEDNWEVHFRDTMRGGKMLNNWRMAQLHAQEAPERVMELEDWGALFDRTDAGTSSPLTDGGQTMPVGWNCTNSMLISVAPARSAIAWPSPVYSQEFEVTLNDLPMPPVARMTVGLSKTMNRPDSRQ